MKYECKPVGMDFLDTSKHRYVAEVIIRASPEQIFDIFEDAASWPEWALPIKKVEWTSPRPFGLGTTRTVTMSGGLTAGEEFIAWERGVRMAFRFTQVSQNSIEAFAEDYQITDLGDGSCRVVWTMAMAPVGVSKIVLGLFGGVMAWSNRYMFSKFKKYVEARVPTTVAVDNA